MDIASEPTPKGQTGKSPHARAGLIMTGAAGCLTGNDALCKLLMPAYSTGEVIAIRSVFVLLLAGIHQWRRPGSAPLFINYRLHAVRAALLGLSAMLFLGGIAFMPLINAIALSFTGPLFVAALSPLILQEHVNAKCWIAIFVGFAGAVLVLNPSLSQFGWPSILPAMSAVTSALGDLMTRRMASSESSHSFVISTAGGTLVVSLFTCFFGWRWPDPLAVATILAASLLIILFYYYMVEALRRAPAFIVAPFRYSALVWGTLLSIVLWNEFPTPGVVAGSLILALSGGYLASGRWQIPG